GLDVCDLGWIAWAGIDRASRMAAPDGRTGAVPSTADAGREHGRHGGRPSKARDHGLARLGVYRLLGLPGLDIFPRGRSAARRARLAQFPVFAQRGYRGPRRVDALDRRGAWFHPLAELPRNVFGVVA